MSVTYGIKPLNEVCSIMGGGTPSKSKKEYYNGDILWATVRDMNVDFLNDTENKITKLGLEKSSSNIVPKGNVVIATRVGLGKVCLLNFDTAINQDLKGIIPRDDNVLCKYLFWWFKSITDKILAAGTGATVQGVKLTFINSLPFPHFPLEEQKQIVAILDQAFAAIDQAQANIQQNIQNAQDLFQSKLNQIFSQQGEGWEEAKMVDVCSILTCGVASTPKYVDESVGVPFLSAQNVRNGEIVLDKYKHISQEFHEHLTKKNKPQKGDVLYSRVGAKFGEAGVVEHDFEFSVYVSVTLIRVLEGKLNNYYFKYYLNSPIIKSLAKSSITSSGVPNLNVKTVREFPVFYPSVSKQIDIVSEIKILEKKHLSLVEKYKSKLLCLEELRKSLLQKAFNGELTQTQRVA